MNISLQYSSSAGIFKYGEPAIAFVPFGVRKLTNGNATVLTVDRTVTTKGGQCLFGS